MDMLTIQGAMAGTKFALEALRAAKATVVHIEAAGKIAEALDHLGQVQDKLFDLRSTLAELQGENLSLKAQLGEQSEWKEQSAKYAMVKAPGGAMVYRTEESPAHYACPRCFADRKMYPLQNKNVLSGDYSCPGCGKSFPVDPPGKLPEINYSPPGGGRGGRNSWMRR